MSFLHCRHASIGDPQPCRCPIWEDPESDGGPCDTCDHRAEWHLTPIEGSLEENRPLERCKADLLPGRPCPCPIWVDNDKSDNKAQCALCGHKKGWHRTKASAMSLPSKAESMRAQGSSNGPSSEPQTDEITQLHHQISELMSRDHQSCPQLVKRLSPSSASGSSTNRNGFRDPAFDMLSGPSFNVSHAETIDPTFEENSGISPDADGRRFLTLVERNPIKIASEHLRFIVEDPTNSPTVSLNETSTAKSNNPFPSTASEAVRSAYLSQASPVLSSSSGRTNPQGASPARPHSPFEALQNDRLCTNYSPKHPNNGASSGYTPQSLYSSKASSDQMTARSSFQEDASHHSSPSFTSGAFPVYPFDGDAGWAANSARSKYTSSNPLRAEVTSHVHVEELEKKSSAHPSELGIGKFSADNSPMSHEAQRQHVIKSTDGSKPFQMGNNISGPEAQFFPDIQLQRSEDYTSKAKNVTLSLSPPPSKHDYTPGEVLTVTIRLKPTTSDTTTDQVLSRWTNITIMLVGTIARNGRRDDHTMHEILRLERLIYPVVGDKRPLRPEWKMSLQIPTHANCPCGPGSLPLPKTCSDSVGHVSYSIILKAKRRQGIIGITTEAITADMRMSAPKTAPSGSLTTKPSSARSKSNWIALTGSHRAAIIGTIFTTQVDYVSPNRLRIVYRLELEFSPDSEVGLSVINDLCENTTVVLSGLAGEKSDAHDVRVSIGEHPRWHMSGYLDVNAPKAVRDSQHILRLSIHTVALSQPVEVYAWLRELSSLCSIRLMGLGMPLIPCF